MNSRISSQKRNEASARINKEKICWDSFVGRFRETQVLADAIDSCPSKFSLTVISGPAGMGKSCLVAQGMAHAARRGILALTAHCSATESLPSYAPLVEILRQYFAAIGSKATFVGSDLREFVQLCPKVDGSLGSQLTKEALESRTALFTSVTSFFISASASGPALLIIEDVHWIDDDSIMLLNHILPSLASCPIALVLTCREEELSPAQRSLVFPDHLSRVDQTILRLQPLTESEVGAYLATLASSPRKKRMLPDLARALTQVSSGNPLFVRQLLQAFTENSPLLAQASLTSIKASSNNETQIDLSATFRVRVAGLSFDCRRMLEAAAILGEESETRLLNLLVDGISDFEQLMSEAVEAGILHLFSTAKEPRCRFNHDIIYHILYSGIPTDQRRRLHAHAAKCILQLYALDLRRQFGRLAHHYEQAESAESLGHALEYWMKAGHVQFLLTAFAKAKNHWKAAYSLAERINADAQVRSRICENLADVELLTSSRPSRAISYMRESLCFAQLTSNREETSRIHARIATLLLLSTSSQDVGLASVHARTADGLLTSAGEDSTGFDLALSNAFLAHSTLATASGLACAERAMKIAERLMRPEKWCQAASLKALFLWAQGDLESAEELFDRACEQAEALPSIAGDFTIALSRGYTSLTLWDPKLASKQFRFAVREADGRQSPMADKILSANAGIAHCLAGELEEARSILSSHYHRFLAALIAFHEGDWSIAEDLLTDEFAQARRTQSRHLEWAYAWWLARICRVKENFDLAEQYLLSSPVLKEGVLRIPEEIATRVELGLLYAQTQNETAARTQLIACKQLMNGGVGWRGLACRVASLEAAIYRSNDDAEGSKRTISTIRTSFKRYNLPFEEAEMLVILGNPLIKNGVLGDGIKLLEEAQNIYQSVGAIGQWTTRIESLISNRPLDGSFNSIEPGMSDTVKVRSGVGKYSNFYALAEEATEKTGSRPQDAIYEYASVRDVALIATFIHDAIAHLMSAINKAAGWKDSLERVADSIDLLARGRIATGKRRTSSSKSVRRPPQISSSSRATE